MKNLTNLAEIANAAASGLSVLVLCDEVGTTGGTESYLSRVLPALRDRGARVEILARRVTDPDAFGIAARTVAWGADDEAPNAEAARTVADAIRTRRPAVVMTSNVHDALVLDAARLAPVLVVRVHDHRMFCPQGDRRYPHFPSPCALPMSAGTCLPNAVLRGCVAGFNPRTLQLLRSREAVRDAALRADRVVVSSSYMARICLTNGLAAERVAIVPPPFGTETARAPRPARDRVLFAGRLVRDKGLGSLIDALATIPARLRPDLAVSGAMTREAENLPARAVRLGVAMTMLGKSSREQLVREIDASTLVAVPSLWPEPFGLMGIEAFARARPVAAYDVGSIPEWIGAAGVLAPCGDAAALGRAIVTVCDPTRWPAFSAAAQRQALGATADLHAAKLLELFASVTTIR